MSTKPRSNYSRDELVAICERAVVPVHKWRNRDSASAQEGVGKAWALLKAGADFTVMSRGQLTTDNRTIWLELTWPGFAHFEYGGHWEDDTVYLPTPQRLDAVDGGDWY